MQICTEMIQMFESGTFDIAQLDGFAVERLPELSKPTC
jgi:hypothetical protein